MATTKNLGFVKAIHSGTTAPTNTQMLWFDTNTGVNKHKAYNSNTSSWELLGTGGEASQFRGNLNPVNFPPSNGSGASSAVRAGDHWRISVAGTISGLLPNDDVEVNDLIYALVDSANEGSEFFTVQAGIDYAALIQIIEDIDSDLQTHKSNTSNPHSVTKSQVALGNVDNTSDLNKPISTATQLALDNLVVDGGEVV